MLMAGAVQPAMLAEMDPDIAFRQGQQAVDGLDGDAAAGRPHQRKMEFAIAAADVGRRNREFHLALVRPSGRGVTVETVDRLLALSERYVRVHLGEHRRLDRASHEHETLLQAWLDRRTEVVRREARTHIRATLIDLRAQLPDV